MATRSLTPSYSLGHPWTPAVKSLILANVTIFLLQTVAISGVWPGWAGLQVPEVFTQLRLWQPATYMFLHHDFWHLLFNMFALWMFGCEVELALGTPRFYAYYLLTGWGAGWAVAALSWLAHENSLVVGASGAIFGILVAYGVLFAERKLTLLLFFVVPVSMKAKTMVWLFAAFEFVAGVGQAFGQVSHVAHLSGLVIGYLLLLVMLPERRPSLAIWKNLRFWWLGKRVSRIDPDDYIDQILEKISTQGINSLSNREREILAEAARRRGRGWPGEN